MNDRLDKGDVAYLGVGVHGLGRGTRVTIAHVDDRVATVRVRRSRNEPLEVYNVLVGQLLRERPPTITSRWV